VNIKAPRNRVEEDRGRVRFSALATLDGYDVIADDTGRPVAHRSTRRSANGVAQTLNCAPLAELGGIIARLRR
jgi:hypothetical protein